MGVLSLLRPAKQVPTTWWSATDPMTTRPPARTLLILIAGLWIFGTGDAILIAAGIGNTPWTVLAEGIALNIDWSVGQATFLVSILVLLLWIPLKEKPGVGTILNAVFISLAIEVMVPNAAIRNLIREDKVHQIYSQMQVGQSDSGMQTMNQSLYDLYMKRVISYEDAIGRSPVPDELITMLSRTAGAAQTGQPGRK